MHYNDSDSANVLVKNYTMCKYNAADYLLRHRHSMKVG